MEGTLNPAYQEGKTVKLIQGFLGGACPESLCESRDPEGHRNDVISSETQLYHCAHAAKYRFEEQQHVPLTVELVCEVVLFIGG
jgi:hypothetical protein